ncbi:MULTISPECIES: threonine-phosphate decarboxylase CobD [unclassified Sporosarcina]|uniref:threonine-phosphate decarboxylase CobD n=1 Tax=unclassified Sporosarcina TaxID=2647733 RepID=UPI00203D8A51|nr:MULTISPECIES: threonine-phosphate decarboxylase CobD [unclassified Sporosarcina]GKV66843.1 threonine-phosphate decarboxylase [Sporosarcina sp. NCCP-2331]GLB57252.1 threonine-phosphate decarboxylase [Sporosarcina sp. NCCP-2378]
MQLPEHGANSARLYHSIGLPVPEKVLDFSENCNPAGLPPSVEAAWPDLITKLISYPDPDGEPFKSAAAAYHGIDPQQVLAGNGAAELLSLLARRYRKKRVLLIDPTFSEYRATLAANEAEVVCIQADEAKAFRLPVEKILAALPNADAVYLCTPNNPTGLLPTPAELLTVMEAAKNCGAEVVLDEAFIDFADEEKSFIAHIQQHTHVIVVRSMTKMYTIPGIRLGYLVAEPAIIASIKQQAPHWHVNGLAAEIGVLCLKEEAYREQAVRHAEKERRKMSDFLRLHGCQVVDSQANYLIFKPAQEAGKLYRYLLGRGYVLRHSENFRGMDGRWLRVGMKTAAMMEQLREEMDAWFAQQ